MPVWAGLPDELVAVKVIVPGVPTVIGLEKPTEIVGGVAAHVAFVP